MVKSHLSIRPMVEHDTNFIYNSWLKSAQADHDLPNSKFFDSYRDHIKEILKRSKVIVACDPEDPTFLHGYMVCQQVEGVFILHWVYVKAPFRKMGVASDLIRSEFPALKQEPLVITYKNNKRSKMYESLKTIYKPEFRSIQI